MMELARGARGGWLAVAVAVVAAIATAGACGGGGGGGGGPGGAGGTGGGAGAGGGSSASDAGSGDADAGPWGDVGGDAGSDAGPETASVCTSAMRLEGRCSTLSDYALFADGSKQVPAPGVVPYDVIAPLFADYAVKHRFLAVPATGRIGYDPAAKWRVPVGTVLVKTFSYPRDARDKSKGERLLETRLLIQGADEIVPITYVWNDEQTEAYRWVPGKSIAVSWIDADGKTRVGEYGVPDTNKCRRCHGTKTPALIGLRTWQLDRTFDYGKGPENQIDHLAALGLLDRAPEAPAARVHLSSPFDAATGSLERRARSYLEANCAHCHNSTAAADWSALYLGFDTRDVSDLGACKRPLSGGGRARYDLVPGSAKDSILFLRMKLTDDPERMPEGSRLPDDEGVRLIGAWIDGMKPIKCAGD